MSLSSFLSDHRLRRGAGLIALFMPLAASAQLYSVVVDGTDAIYLAGRDDVVVPALGSPFAVLARHGYVNADFEAETFPDMVPVAGGDVVRVLDPVDGWIDFFNGYGNAATGFGPEGNTAATSTLGSLAGLSGWIGTQGALAGVFLDDTNPVSGTAPAALNFSTALSRDFVSLSPELGQVFFIGDGVNGLGDFQEFVAPAGATRLFLGIPDGFAFNGPPGAYEDNDGEYRIAIGVNQIPSDPSVPEPAAIGWMSVLLIGSGLALRRRRRS